MEAVASTAIELKAGRFAEALCGCGASELRIPKGDGPGANVRSRNCPVPRR